MNYIRCAFSRKLCASSRMSDHTCRGGGREAGTPAHSLLTVLNTQAATQSERNGRCAWGLNSCALLMHLA